MRKITSRVASEAMDDLPLLHCLSFRYMGCDMEEKMAAIRTARTYWRTM